MPYLLDSNVLIEHLNSDPQAEALLAELAPDGVYISMITYMETYQGILRTSNSTAAETQLEALLAEVPVLPFSFEVARRCARLRDGMRRQGRPVNRRALDFIIAATALEHDLTLVTRDPDDYRDIPSLTLYRSE